MGRVKELAEEVDYDVWAFNQALQQILRAKAASPKLLETHKDDLAIIADKVNCLMYDLETK